MMKQKNNWEWFGYSAHFIGGNDCRFHLTTIIANGKYVVSTVGDYRPLLSKCNKRKEVGYKRFFETKVFEFEGRCEDEGCGCRVPIITSEIDRCGYQTAGEAQAGHLAICEKWDKPEKP